MSIANDESVKYACNAGRIEALKIVENALRKTADELFANWNPTMQSSDVAHAFEDAADRIAAELKGASDA
jgi:hypothetical protein